MSPVLRHCHRHGLLHPGRCPQCEAERRARLDVHRKPAGQRFRRLVLERDGYVCRWCGERATSVDYLQPLARGGRALDAGNAVASCKRCNSRRGAQVTNG